MLRSYLIIMFRNLLKRKGFTFINLLGLSTGLAVTLLLALYIQNELGYDRFYKNGDRICRLALERIYPGRSAFRGQIPLSIGAAVQQEFPEVESYTRIMNFDGGGAVNYAGKDFSENRMGIVDSSFFYVFGGDFVAGDIHKSLQAPFTAVVNSSTAIRIFGSIQDALNKDIVLNGYDHYRVTGIYKDWPEKAHFQLNILLSAAGNAYLHSSNYYDLTTYTYLLLKKNSSVKTLEAKLPLIVEKYVAGSIEKGFNETYQQFKKEGNGYHYFLQPVSSIHLHSKLEDEFHPGVNITVIYLCSAIGVFILFLACINFINLSTAVSVERAREVGMRKVFGSRRASLVRQFLTESIAFAVASLIIASFIAWLLLPLLNRITGSSLNMQWYTDPFRMLVLISVVIALGIIAGLYPAFILSSFRPILVLKGNFRSGKRGLALRNVLVVFQFAVSIVLIIATWVVNVQMAYMTGDNLGFNKDHVVAIPNLWELHGQGSTFISEARAIPGVQTVSLCSQLPDGDALATCAMQVVDTRVTRTDKTVFTDEEYLAALGLQLTQGRFFSRDFGTDSLSLVLNEAALKDFGLKNPVGTRLTSSETFFNAPDGKTNYVYTVIGVVKDYHFESMHNKIAPLVIANTGRFGTSAAAIKIKADHFKTTIASIESKWKSFSKKGNFQYSFLDERLEMQYKSEQNAQRIFTIFSILAIFIACIGLLGLATYTTLQRRKEISMRKVLGASNGNIVFILSKDFIKLVILSSVVAFPLAGWVLYNWLQGYAYRVNLNPWIFVSSATITIVIALVTISFQAVKAGMTSPAKNLRSE
jgi:putative ABC transport system permease protein